MSRRKFLSQDRQFQVDVGWEPKALGGFFFLHVFGPVPGEGYFDKKWDSADHWPGPSMSLTDISDVLQLWKIEPPEGLFKDLEVDESTDDSRTSHWYLDNQESQ